MGILQVGLFGSVRVTHNGWISESQLTRENQRLLAYLLLQRQKLHSREVLAGMFWGEYRPDRARGSLNTALWKIKKVLEPDGIPSGTYLKNSHAGKVGFNRDSPYWLDIQVFEDEIDRILIKPFQTVEKTHILELEKVLGLYKGDLLEGFYQDWALRERERLRSLYVKSLIYLLQYYGFHRAFHESVTYAEQILDLDPLREDVHREIMRLHLENGQRALAIRQYEICCATLEKELGIFPMEDTQALYHQILTTGNNRNGSSTFSQERTSFEEALRQLKEASQAIDLAKEQVQQALQLMAKYPEIYDKSFMSKPSENEGTTIH